MLLCLLESVQKTQLVPTYTSGSVCVASQESFRDPSVTTWPCRAKHSPTLRFPGSSTIIMALLATLPTLVPQKTTDAVTENNYSFRHSLLLEKQFGSTPPTLAASPPIYPGTSCSQREALPSKLHHRSILPLIPLSSGQNGLDIYPSVMQHQNSTLITLLRNLEPLLASLL